MWLYNLFITICVALARIMVAPFNPKVRAMLDGRRGMFEHMQRVVNAEDRLVWIHVASLGDFEQGRPLVDYIHAKYPDYKIVLTFFSSSGYEVRKEYPNADYVFYIPIDRRCDVCRFLDIVKPEIAIFVKYEFWLNMLVELRKRGIRTFITSAIFRRNSIFFSPFGWWWYMQEANIELQQILTHEQYQQFMNQQVNHTPHRPKPNYNRITVTPTDTPPSLPNDSDTITSIPLPLPVSRL